MKGKRWILFWLACWCMTGEVCGQLDSVAFYLEKIKTEKEDSLRLEYAERMVDFLGQTPFGAYLPEQPVKYLNYKRCTHAAAELYCWVVPLQQGEAFFHFFRFQEEGKSYDIKYLPGGEEKEQGWLFYDWLAFQQGEQTYFLLLGWNHDRKLNRKTIRIVRFTEGGEIVAGPALIHRDGKLTSFLDFAYATDGSMMLKQDCRGKRIIFDHLSPNDPRYEGYYMLYGADGSCDALEWKDGKWWYRTDVPVSEER